MALKGRAKRERRRELRKLRKSGQLTRSEARQIKNNEFRDGKSAFGKILGKYVAPAVAVGGAVVGTLAISGALGGAAKVVKAAQKASATTKKVTTAKKMIEKIAPNAKPLKSLVNSSDLPRPPTLPVNPNNGKTKFSVWDFLGKKKDDIEEAKGKLDDLVGGVKGILSGAEANFKGGVVNDRAERSGIKPLAIIGLGLLALKWLK